MKIYINIFFVLGDLTTKTYKNEGPQAVGLKESSKAVFVTMNIGQGSGENVSLNSIINIGEAQMDLHPSWEKPREKSFYLEEFTELFSKGRQRCSKLSEGW